MFSQYRVPFNWPVLRRAPRATSSVRSRVAVARELWGRKIGTGNILALIRKQVISKGERTFQYVMGGTSAINIGTGNSQVLRQIRGKNQPTTPLSTAKPQVKDSRKGRKPMAVTLSDKG